jgi:hypothetical protein
MNNLLDIILIIVVIFVGYLLFIKPNNESFASAHTVSSMVNTQYNNSPFNYENSNNNVIKGYVNEVNKHQYDKELDNLVKMTQKKRHRKTKVNGKYLDMQFHNNYRDVLTAINNIAPDQKQIFNMGNIPVITTIPNTSEVKNMVDQFIQELNKNIKSEVSNVLTKNSGWDDLAPQKKVKTGWEKEQDVLGVVDIYDDPAKKSSVRLVKIMELEKQETEAEQKYLIKLIIQKKNVKEQMILKLSFVIPKIVTDERTLFKNAHCGSEKYITDNPNSKSTPDKLGSSNVIMEEIFVVGFLSDDDENNIMNYNPNDFEEYSFQRMDNNEVLATSTIMKELQKKFNQRKCEAEKFNNAMDNETRKFHESMTQQNVY